MTTTPEQLAKWRKEFEAPKTNFYTRMSAYRAGEYDVPYIEDQWRGYLRAKQENEQINEGVLFLAKFAAQTINSSDHAASHYPVVQDAIKELLK